MPQNNPFEIRASGDSEAELLVYGDIGDSWWGESVTAKDTAEKLAAMDVSKIVVRINSYGGSVADGLAIYNALRGHKAQIEVRIDGVAVSIASLIAMAGDTVRMSENALFMVHAPWGGAMGNAKELREYADVLDTYAKAMASSYVRKTGQTHDAIMALLTDGVDHYYVASEAKEFGFVDEVIGEEMAAAAGFNRSRFAVPGALAALRAKPLTTPAAVVATPPTKEETTMPEANTPATPPQAAVTPAVRTEAEIFAAEGQRKADIRARFKAHLHVDGVQAMLDACIDDHNVTPQAAADKLLAKLGQGAEPLAGAPRIEMGADSRDKKIGAATDALLARMGAAAHDRANPYRGMRLSDMARACLEDSGVNVRGMTAEEFAPMALTHGPVRGAQTTSDFPVILENTMHKLVLSGFRAQPTTWDRFCKIGDVTDFRSWNRIVPGLIGNLDDVNEHGEYKNKSIPDGVKNSVQAKRKGNIIEITPEVLVNDDVGYISDLASGLGRSGSRAIERAVYALLVSNPTLSDGVALFHASHANLAGSGAQPTVDLLDAAAGAMAVQTAPGDDAEYLDITPAVAVVHTGKRGNMMVLIGAEYDPDTANKLQRPNKVKGLVRDVVGSPRVGANPWYLFADPTVAPVLEVVFLNGQRDPRLVVDENFRTGGLAWRVELPFGVGAIDYRGAYMNPGA